MEDNQVRGFGVSGSAHKQEVRIKSKMLRKPIQGFPSLVTLWSGCGCGAGQLHSFQPGGFSSLVHSSVRILNIRRWTQSLGWLGRPRRRLKLRYQNVILMLLAVFQGHYLLLIFYQ